MVVMGGAENLHPLERPPVGQTPQLPRLLSIQRQVLKSRAALVRRARPFSYPASATNAGQNALRNLNCNGTINLSRAA
jgi:hypothetical protein